MSSAQQLSDVETPALVLDRPRLARNVARMEARCRELGVAHRPHLKTSKSLEVSRLIPSARGHGATVSTVREAEYFAADGISDLLYAVSIAPGKLPRLARVAETGARLHLAVDHPDTLRLLAEGWATLTEATASVLLEIDCGEHRSGLEPDDPLLLQLARSIEAATGLALGGVFTHGGQSYGAAGPAGVRAVAESERATAVAARDALRSAGHDCGIVSVGSTPTAMHAEHLRGVTELRAGVHVFGDVFQAALGSCALDDVALSVLTTVVGHQRHGRCLVVDAGGLALSKDRSTAGLAAEHDCGYGLLTTREGRLLEGLRVAHAYQEHGMVELPSGASFADFPIGSQLRVLPNHACMTAAAHDCYHVVDDDPERVVAVWSRINGW